MQHLELLRVLSSWDDPFAHAWISLDQMLEEMSVTNRLRKRIAMMVEVQVAGSKLIRLYGSEIIVRVQVGLRVRLLIKWDLCLTTFNYPVVTCGVIM